MNARLKKHLASFFQNGFRPEPVSAGEWFCLRLCFGALVFFTILEPHPFRYEAQPLPTGIAHFADLTWLHWWQLADIPFFKGGPGMHETFVALGLVLCAAYVAGRGLVITLPLLALLHILPRTLNNSQGFTHHGFQLVSLVLVAQTLVAWWFFFRRKRAPSGQPDGPALPSCMLYYSAGVVALSYTVSALTKLTATRGLWIWDSHAVCIEIVKSHRLLYFARLDPEFAVDPSSALWLLHHPWITRILFGAGFLLELFAFVAIKGRPWALLTGLSIIAFHRSVWWLMKLEFPLHEWLLLIFLVNIPFWIDRLLRGHGARNREQGAGSREDRPPVNGLRAFSLQSRVRTARDSSAQPNGLG